MGTTETMGIIGTVRAREEFTFVLENPWNTSLRGGTVNGEVYPPHPAIARLEEETGVKVVEVRMRAYGFEWCKPTALWTNLYPRWWKPRDPMVWCVVWGKPDG